MHYLAVDHHTGCRHDPEGHDCGDVRDLFDFDLDAGILRCLGDDIGCDLAIAAPAAEDLDLFHYEITP
jgi:hypothetical protein